MTTDPFEMRRRGLEAGFFANREAQLIEKLRATFAVEHPRETLRQMTGIHDEAVLDTLVALHVNHDTLAAFGLYPLVEIAWADGTVDEEERKAFLKAAAAHGLAPGTPGHEALTAFLKETPREEARKAWFAWASELNRKLDPEERRKVREALLARARAVAEATGGFLGLGSRISAGEQRILDRIADAFSD